MQSHKIDFPLLQSHPDLVFLDSASSTQKPKCVIDGIRNFLENDYANIHRGTYSLAEKSEDLYVASKTMTARMLGWKASEVIYTYNATYAYNMLATTLIQSTILQSGDIVIVDISSHHANIVPRQMLTYRH
jgi:cysteine desulfurase / selenocysteine lyase